MEVHAVCIVNAHIVDHNLNPTGATVPHLCRAVFSDRKVAQRYARSEGGTVSTLMVDDPVKLAGLRCSDATETL